MPEENKLNQDKRENSIIWKVLIGAIFSALLTILLFTYEQVARNGQFVMDHMHEHEREVISCSDYRAAVRREMDLIWKSIMEVKNGQKN